MEVSCRTEYSEILLLYTHAQRAIVICLLVRTRNSHKKIILEMARSRGSGGSGGRSGSRGGMFGGSSGQTRPASTMAAPAPSRAAPTPYSQPPAAAGAAAGAGSQARQPGMFAQMASTAAGVAVGSAVGHTIGAGLTGMFSGNSAAQEMQDPNQLQAQSSPLQQQQAQACDVDARNFTRCLDENSGNFQICDYYLQQLKACQEAARPY